MPKWMSSGVVLRYGHSTLNDVIWVYFRYGHTALDDAVRFKQLLIIDRLRAAGATLQLPPMKQTLATFK